MARFLVMSPEGQKFQVEAPEGATHHDAMRHVRRHVAQTKMAPVIAKHRAAGNHLEADLLQGHADSGWDVEHTPRPPTALAGQTNQQ